MQAHSRWKEEEARKAKEVENIQIQGEMIMVYVSSKEGSVNLGKFKSVRCRTVIGVKTCKVYFSKGKLTIPKRELMNISDRVHPRTF